MRRKQTQLEEETVKINMGSADRRLRAFVVAPVLVVGGVLAGPAGWLAFMLYVLAAVMLATAAAGSCPPYALFGLRTCPLQRVSTHEAESNVSR